MIENRKTYRLPFRTKFIFSCRDRVYAGNSLNISAGGIFVSLLESSDIVRDSACRCVFALNEDDSPLCVEGVVKRVIATDPNPEVLPGVAFNFVEGQSLDLDRLKEFMGAARQNFELSATILSSGEPDLNSLEPLIQKMHLPPSLDLGELRFQIERILLSIELVDKNNARLEAANPPKT